MNDGIRYNPETRAVEVSNPELHDTLRSAAVIGFTKYVTAPMLLMGTIDGVITHGEILGVWVHPNEEVEWVWFDERVIGYNIVQLV